MNLDKGNVWEKKAASWLKETGCEVIRLDTLRTKHLPDYLVLRDSTASFVEIKSMSGRPSLSKLRSQNPRQFKMMQKLAKNNLNVKYLILNTKTDDRVIIQLNDKGGLDATITIKSKKAPTGSKITNKRVRGGGGF